jgi:Flp pilus assembly pilin Flp
MGRSTPLGRLHRDDRGSAVVEFTLVAMLLTALCLGVVQLALALHVRNTIQDAASEGARIAALAGAVPHEGAERTRELITMALGPGYAVDVTAAHSEVAGYPGTRVRVLAPLPLLGLLGIDSALEVTGHAALEIVD